MSATDRPAILLFTASPALDPLERALQARGLAAVRVPTAEAGRQLLATRRGRAIAVLDTTRPSPYSFAAVYRLLHAPPAVPTLVLLAENAPPLSPAPPDAAPSLDDYARLPAPLEELVLRVQALVVRAGLSLPDQPALASSVPVVEPPRVRGRQVVAMFGPKGGVGRSTIATNLAVGLVQLYGKQVVLVDADLWFGDVSVLLDLHSNRSLASLIPVADQLDRELLRTVLVEHPSGVQAVLAPPDPALVETIPVALPARVAEAYRDLFDHVVIDTHPSMEEYILQLLDAADRIVVVTTPEMSSIRNTAQVLRLATALHLRDKMLLVLNRANSGIQVEHLEETVGMRVDVSIVSAGRRVVEAANHGLPVLLMDPLGKEQITRDLGRLVAKVAGEAEPRWDGRSSAPERRPLWRPPWTG